MMDSSHTWYITLSYREEEPHWRSRGRGMGAMTPDRILIFFLELKRVVGSPELSDVTEVMMYRDIQDTYNVP